MRLGNLGSLPARTIAGIAPGQGTGLCILRNGRAEAQSVANDEHALDLAIKASADLVLLSIASGSLDVGTDAPYEPSGDTSRMTVRAEAIATLFRSCGIPVIGSDPGAAVRVFVERAKYRVLQRLSSSLQQLGIVGVTPLTAFSPTEVDAIASAAVGLCFWAGRFEISGPLVEGSLITPNLHVDRWSNCAVIGLSGPIAAGKTTAGMHLRALGFHYARYSWIVEDIAREAGREPSRETLQDLGRELHQTRGQRWLGRKLLERLPASGCIVIDGLRYPDDHAFMTESFGPCFHHLAIRAPFDIRARRFTSSRPGEDYERAVAHASEQGVQEVGRLAHRSVENGGSKEELQASIESAVRQMLSLRPKAPECLQGLQGLLSR